MFSHPLRTGPAETKGFSFLLWLRPVLFNLGSVSQFQGFGGLVHPTNDSFEIHVSLVLFFEQGSLVCK